MNKAEKHVFVFRSHREAVALSRRVLGGQHLTSREPAGGSSFRLIAAAHDETFHPRGVEQAITLLGFRLKASSTDWLLFSFVSAL